MLRVPNARELMAGLTYGRIRPTSLSSGLRYPVGTASRVRPACSPAVPTAALIGFGAARFFRRSAVECPVITVVSGRQMLHQGSHHFAPRLEGGLDVRHLLAQRQPSAVNYVSQNIKPSASVTGTPVLSPPHRGLHVLVALLLDHRRRLVPLSSAASCFEPAAPISEVDAHPASHRPSK
jgi:hypothetical protein